MLAAARIQRCALLLSAYQYTLEYRSTLHHSNVSKLSVPQSVTSQPSELSIYNVGQAEFLSVTVTQLQKAIGMIRCCLKF